MKIQWINHAEGMGILLLGRSDQGQDFVQDDKRTIIPNRRKHILSLDDQKGEESLMRVSEDCRGH